MKVQVICVDLVGASERAGLCHRLILDQRECTLAETLEVFLSLVSAGGTSTRASVAFSAAAFLLLGPRIQPAVGLTHVVGTVCKHAVYRI